MKPYRIMKMLLLTTTEKVNRRFSFLHAVPLALILFLCVFILPETLWAEEAVKESQSQASLEDFSGRLSHIKDRTPDVIKAAEASVASILQSPETALLHIPYTDLTGLGDELQNRAGGLAHARTLYARRNRTTEDDVVLLSVRAWETDGEEMLEKLNTYRDEGWTTTLIASSAGAPDDVKEMEDVFFIDNGAPDGSSGYGRINVLANTALAWMWTCEYVSAMTRQGWLPGILISIDLPGGRENNRPLQTRQGRLKLTETEVAIPPGELARKYAWRLEQLADDLAGAKRQNQIKDAADITAEFLNNDRNVVVAGVGHLITGEQNKDHLSPFQGRHFRQVLHGELERDFNPGDLLIWIGYSGGVNSGHNDFSKNIAKAEMDVITSYTKDPRREKCDLGEIPEPLAHIDQTWAIGDSEVRMVVPPGHMAPISGINAMLILRMLDDEVVRRLD